jgi:hypothetical protein
LVAVAESVEEDESELLLEELLELGVVDDVVLLGLVLLSVELLLGLVLDAP